MGSLDEFLDRKRDYSPFLVHLTRDDEEFGKPARDVLRQILDNNILLALNHYCYFSPSLNDLGDDDLANRFKVVCFTETPIDQIHVLLDESIQRQSKPKPYELVFTKDYLRRLRHKRGNPVFYTTTELVRPLLDSVYQPLCNGKLSYDVCELLALMTLCEKGNDWHWEREWRVVGDLRFKLSDVFCGLCREEDVPYFQDNYREVTFISPYWSINKILDKLVEKRREERIQEDVGEFPF